MKKFLRYLLIGFVFPLLVQYVFYFQFTPNYTQDLFSEQSFTTFYNSHVYQTRKLGKELHLWTYHKLYKWEKMKNFRENEYTSRRLKPLDPNADMVFYLTYFFISAFFSVLISLTLLYLFDDRLLFAIEIGHKDMAVCFFILLIGFTQFVVTPYDTLGYFFQSVGMMLFLKNLYRNNWMLLVLFLLVIVLATTNRETSLILLSFMAAIYYTVYGINLNWIKKMILPVVSFVIPYLWLKLQPGAGKFMDESQLSSNFNLLNPFAMMGFLFAVFIIFFIYHINRNKPLLIHSFLFFSLPYIFIIFVAGITQEFRLWMPLIEGALILSFLNLPHLTSQLKKVHS